MSLIAVVLTSILGSTGLSTIIVTILQHRWEKDKRIDAIMLAQRCSMEERIRYLVGHYVNKGEITLAEKSNLKEMHRAYVGVGGNGNLDPEMTELDKIPVKG